MAVQVLRTRGVGLEYAPVGYRRSVDDEKRRERVAVVVNPQRSELADEAWLTGRAMTVMVTNNGQRSSAELTVAPGSAPDDGELDVVVQRTDTIRHEVLPPQLMLRCSSPRPDQDDDSR